MAAKLAIVLKMQSGHKTVGVRNGTGNPIRLVRNEFFRRLTGCFMTNFCF